jgi:hypothetical protein
MCVMTVAGRDSFTQEFSILVLAGAGGLEPPRRGIKIRLPNETLRGFGANPKSRGEGKSAFT